jgi:WD40 repeat protein
MKTRRFHCRTLQLVAFSWLFCTGAATLGQGGVPSTRAEQILWSKEDAEPLLNVAFSTDGTILALGREDSNTTDLLNASDGSLIRSLTASHNRVNDAVFTFDDQDLIVGTGSGGDTLTLDLWRVSDGVRLIRHGAHTNGTHKRRSFLRWPITHNVWQIRSRNQEVARSGLEPARDVHE